jgi:hypothetical protein
VVKFRAGQGMRGGQHDWFGVGDVLRDTVPDLRRSSNGEKRSEYNYAGKRTHPDP